MPMKIGPAQLRIAAEVFSPRAVCASSQMTIGDLARVAHEPLVGLDGHLTVRAVLSLQQRRADALGVAAVAQLAVELVDEVAAVGEDQRAAGARRLDEAERGDRLAGAGGVLEPEALARVGILGRLGQLIGVLTARVLPVLWLVGLVAVLILFVVELLLAGDRGGRRVRFGPGLGHRAAVAVAQRVGEQRGQRARERVDLVRGEDGAVDQRRLGDREHPLESEQQRELAAPLDRGDGRAGGHLGQRGVERPAPRGAGRERGREVVALRHEGFTGEAGGPLDVVR
jgi:hypothetical protein